MSKDVDKLAKYLLKRIGQSIFTLVIILSLVFVMVRQMPIDGYFDNIEDAIKARIEAEDKYFKEWSYKNSMNMEVK